MIPGNLNDIIAHLTGIDPIVDDGIWVDGLKDLSSCLIGRRVRKYVVTGCINRIPNRC